MGILKHLLNNNLKLKQRQKMRFSKIILIAGLAALLSSCGGPFTRLTKSEYVDANKSFRTNLPVGWVQITGPQSSDALWISKDGYSLQSIRVDALKLEKAFPTIKKPATTTIPISDLAELEIAEIKAKSSNAASIKVLENTLESVSEQKAFRLHIQYLNDKGLRFEQVTYGLATPKNYYRITYQAPTLHYYERDKQAFNQTVTSFKVIN